MPLLRCTFRGNAGGQVINNVLSIQDTGSGSGTVQDTVNIYSRAWVDRILPVLGSTYVYAGLVAYDLQSDAASYESATGAGVGGGVVGPILPLFCNAKVELRTARRGRAGRGRTGLSPIPESYTADTSGSGQGLTTTAVASLQAAFNGFMTDIASTGGTASPGTLMVVSTTLNGLPRPAPVATLVESASVSTMLGTRLSRKVY